MSVRIKRWGDMRKWLGPRTQDRRPYFDASVMFQAADMDEAEKLYARMLDAIGCDQHADDEEPCLHFRGGGLHLMEEDA